MPNRIIKESINESEGLSNCSIFSEELYKRLITYADDNGRFNSDTMIMRARLFPREYEYISEEDIINALIELAGNHKISFYTPDVFGQHGQHGVYGAFPNWDKHQRIRNSKKKCPDIADTSINDWYLRRFISKDMKIAILERDNMKCTICGKYITSCKDINKFLKLAHGLYHIDHIVPVVQGGRSTLENLRLTCSDCNLKRKRSFTFSDLIEEYKNSLLNAEEKNFSPQFAASFGNSQLESNPNPIQSESNLNPNTNIGRENKKFIPPTVEEVEQYCKECGFIFDAEYFVDYYTANGWMVGKQKMKDWKAAVRYWNKNQQKGGQSYGQPTRSSGQDANSRWGIVPNKLD